MGVERRRVVRKFFVALMEKTVIMNGGDYSVVEEEGKAGFGGGVEDVYGEDSATEDQLVTPWTVSVAR